MRAVGVAGEGLLFRQVNDANNSYTNRMIIDTSGNVGVGTITPEDRLDIVGNLRVSSSKTANTNKTNRIRGEHYNVAEEPTTFMFMNSFSATNQLHIGGGSSVENAATSLTFFTAANNTTTAGTLALTIDSSQNATFASKVGIGTTASLNGLLNVGSPSATNVKVSRIAGDTTTVYQYGSSEDATLEWTCGSYFNSEVVITASQTNGGTYNNLYIRGIWSNNHTSHHWDELEHVGSLTGTTFTITNGQNGSTAASGRLTLGVDYVNGSFATLNIRITDFFGTHAYTIT